MTIQGDERFQKFRRKLEDACLMTINSCKTISARIGTHCPLGSHELAQSRTPFPCHAARLWGLTNREAESFISGFDHDSGEGPYAELGRLYRARFP